MAKEPVKEPENEAPAEIDSVELEKAYSGKLARIAELEKEVKALKASASSDEATLLKLLSAAGGEGELYKVVKEPVKYDSAEWWKKYDSKAHKKYSVECTIQKFSLELLIEKDPEAYKKAKLLTNSVLKAK